MIGNKVLPELRWRSTVTDTNERTEAPREPRVPREPRPPRVRPWVAAGGLHRASGNLVTVGIGSIAGYISWLHLYALGTSQPLTPGLSARQEHTVAALTPFSIDGLILVGTLKLRQARLEDRPAHWAAYMAVLLGVGLTLAGNIASAPDALWARILAAAPPAAFLISVEVLAGKPLTRNLWDLLRLAWRSVLAWRSARSAAQDKHPGARPSAQPAAPAPTPVPAPLPAPEAPVGPAAVNGPERPAERPTPRVRVSAPAQPRAAATRGGGRGNGAAPGLVTGSKTRPARLVGDVVLEGDALKQSARSMAARELDRRVATGQGTEEARVGLGAWTARQYNPPMSDRWGQERVAEVPDPEPQPAGGPAADLTDATGLVLIDPEVPTEQAVPIDGSVGVAA